jgi:hypothetical protein
MSDRLLSGDHTDPPSMSVLSEEVDLSVFIVHADGRDSRALTNASLAPSGDQTGSL